MRKTIAELTDRAKELRAIALRMAYASGAEGAHIGPAFSIMDIMAVLYFDIMNHRISEPKWEDRDRFVLSKGHACLGLYAPLAMYGYLTEEQINSFNQPHTKIAGHPSGKDVVGIEHPAGSLGHGLSIGCGLAKAAKLSGRDYDTYVVIGDGEANEGSIWEAAMFAAHHKLDNLTVIVDCNGFQYGGVTDELMGMQGMADRWKSFGWNVAEVDGHDIENLQKVLNKQKKKPTIPTCIVAHTIKGYGVQLFEGNDWHHGVVTKEVLEESLRELEGWRLAQ
ncbi:MAG: transketolase [Clostridiales bacterium]|nr:transketolase [Clostridiales bacterium]